MVKTFRAFMKSSKQMGKRRFKYDSMFLTPTARIVENNLHNPEYKEADRFPIAFFKKADKSLIESFDGISDFFGSLGMDFSPDYIRSLSNTIMTIFLLSHAELKEAEEILNYCYQYSRNNSLSNKNVTAFHVGGAAHAEGISYVLKSQIDNHDAIQVRVVDDPRFNNKLDGNTDSAFFKERIPFGNRLKAVRADGFEVYVDPQLILESIRGAISSDKDLEELRKIHESSELARNLFHYEETLDSYKDWVDLSHGFYGIDNPQLLKTLFDMHANPAKIKI